MGAAQAHHRFPPLTAAERARLTDDDAEVFERAYSNQGYYFGQITQNSAGINLPWLAAIIRADALNGDIPVAEDSYICERLLPFIADTVGLSSLHFPLGDSSRFLGRKMYDILRQNLLPALNGYGVHLLAHADLCRAIDSAHGAMAPWPWGAGNGGAPAAPAPPPPPPLPAGSPPPLPMPPTGPAAPPPPPAEAEPIDLRLLRAKRKRLVAELEVVDLKIEREAKRPRRDDGSGPGGLSGGVVPGA